MTIKHQLADRRQITSLERSNGRKDALILSGNVLHTSSLLIRQSALSQFNGRRLVVFSGGAAKDLDGVLNEIRQIRDGGGTGSIIGRNSFQRPKEDALKMLDTIIKIYQGTA